MARKRYGGFSDPEPEVVEEVTTEIEEAAEPTTFDEEPIEAEVGEEKELEVVSIPDATQTITPETPNLPYKITISINALNIRTGPGSSYQAVGITKKGSVHKILEEQDGWGRIGDDRWINLSKRFVEKD